MRSTGRAPRMRSAGTGITPPTSPATCATSSSRSAPRRASPIRRSRRPGEGTASDCTLERGIFDMTTAFHQSLVALGVPHVWKDYGAGCHTIPNFRREFTDSLPGLEDVFAHPATGSSDVQLPLDRAALHDLGMADRRRPGASARVPGATGRRPQGSDPRRLGHDQASRRPRSSAAFAPSAWSRCRHDRAVAPDREGRLHFTVDLDAAQPSHVRFAPHSRLVLDKLQIRHGRARACVTSVGSVVRGVRISLSVVRGPRLARSRPAKVSAEARCVRLTGAEKAGHAGYVVRAKGTDRFGHRVATSQRLPIGSASS